MFNSTVLDVAVGLAFVYLMLALLCTALNEWWSKQLGLRGEVLREGIHSLLGAGPQGNDLTRAFYSNPLIKAISGSGGHPSYISPRMFAQALADALRGLSATRDTPISGDENQSLQSLVERMSESPTKNLLQAILRGTENSSEAGLARISDWFKDSMDRVSGWYKRKIQFVTLIMAALLTIVTNADTLQIVNRLWTNPTLRASVVARAQERAKQSPPIDLPYKESPLPNAPAAASSGQSDASSHPILTTSEKEALGGLLTWTLELREFNKRSANYDLAEFYKSKGINEGATSVVACPDCAQKIAEAEKAQTDSTFHLRAFATHPLVLLSWLYWLIPVRIVGWAITVYAISLGAPFWFGLLQKLVNIRSTGDAPDEKNQVSIHP